MPFDLTAESFAEMLADDAPGGMPVTDTRAWPDAVGRGTFGCTEVRPGVVLYVVDLAPRADVRIAAAPGAGYFAWGYHLHGESEGTIDHAPQVVHGSAGASEALFAPPGHGGVVRFLPAHPVLTVAIGVAPAALLQLVPAPESRRAERWFDGMTRQAPFVETPRPLTADTDRLARQIVDCPFIGRTRELFLEATVLELLAREAGEPPGGERPRLSPDDEQVVHSAAAILRQHLETPPSLRGLARMAGTNELKLKRGFRAVFGTTVFGYLRRQRLEQARHLLVHRRVSVTEAAGLVGYACPSRFAAAFRRHFGSPPSAVRLGR
jgi:AraC-like DNA-binding protein